MKKKFSPTQLTVLVLTLCIVAVLTLMWTASTTASEPLSVDKPDAGPPPTMVNYQGTIRVDGGIYEGTGYFKFAIVGVSTGGGSNIWAHDGTASGEPTTYITRTVTNGLFNILLGDTSITSMTVAITESVFNTTDTYLRVWFSDTSSGFQALEPNQRFASVAYALRAQYAETYTETDPVFTAHVAHSILPGDITKWNQAHGWGNHALAGYDTTDDDWVDGVGGTDVTTQLDVGIGLITPATQLHIRDNDATSSAPQFIIEKGPAGSSYQTYTLGPSGADFSTGYDDGDKNYKTTNTSSMPGTSPQSDGVTMLQAHPSGILDFNNQSRARAHLNHVQFIPYGIWTPIEYDVDSPLTAGYDEHNEFTPWPIAPTGNFIATEEGYYQVHARTAFEYIREDFPQYNPMGYVSIAIFVTDASGLQTMYAQGNNLMMVALNPYGPDEPPIYLLMNNAPNVSDVVYLRPGDMVEIHAWQDFDGNPVNPISLYTGPSQTYVSIHKDS